MLSELNQEIEADKPLLQDNDECNRLRAFIKWFGETPNLKIRYRGEGDRILIAARDIKEGEFVLQVPHEKILTT